MNVTAPVRAGPRPREGTCDSTQRDTVETKMRFIALSISGLAPSSSSSPRAPIARRAVLISSLLGLGCGRELTADALGTVHAARGAITLGGPMCPTWAQCFFVRNAAASGPDSLAQAVTDANARPGLDRIVFDIPGTG